LAIMAHEIRTPLHQVTGFIDLLDQTELNPEQKSFVKLLKSSAQGLMTVISDVLDYSKIEAGKMKMECIPYEPLRVMEGSMEAVRQSCEEKNLFLNLDWSREIPFKVMGDPNRLRQILLNLLSNAVKFTKNGGIDVQVFPYHESTESPTPEASGGTTPRATIKKATVNTIRRPYVKFVVRDTGIGISEEHQDLIFKKYKQGNASVARHFGGTGLGLSICKLLVRNMGGTIGVDSKLGKGASFWFALPADLATEKDLAEPAEDNADQNDYGGLNVLIAEDNRVNQKLLASMLKRMGHKSTLAENGKEAIERVQEAAAAGGLQQQYDVVLMDIQMPVMDGLEATRRLRTLGYTNLPIYGLTASVQRSDFSELGLDDWIPKPVPMKDLKSKLYRLQKCQSLLQEK
jgi:CheY-like chemotaxis protein